ncbi:MAG: TetR/AcrR family transcriptional regulator [Planctomycetaceae bacterium]|nr:TetR/AcrR family transcriptional regulator [Planctomycetaceae bacterium]
MALCAAMELFWMQGYAATSLDELLAAMRLSRSSFYAEFGSKEALFRACLQHYQTTIVTHLSLLQEKAKSTRDFFAAIFRDVITDASIGTPRGCFIVNSAVEFGQRNSRFARDVRSALAEVQRVFESAIQRGVERGELAHPQSAAGLATYLITCLSGLRAMIRGGMTATDARTVVKRILDSLEKSQFS